MSDKFSNIGIDGGNQNLEDAEKDEESTFENEKQGKLKGMTGGKYIIQLNSNFIPKGLIPLEKLFDINDVGKNTKVHPHEDEIQDQIIRTKDQLKVVKLSKALSIWEKNKYVELMKIFSNVFAWS